MSAPSGQRVHKTWGLKGVEPLTELCIRCIVANFEQRHDIARIPPKYKEKVIALLPITLPLEIAAKVIDSDDYWKRVSLSRWSGCDVSLYGGSWKRLFFEREVQHALEAFDPSTQQLDALKRLLGIAKDFVLRIVLEQLLSHIDLTLLFQSLPVLQSLQLTYGAKNLGTNFEFSIFGMKPDDCRTLAAALQTTAMLHSISLPNNLLDDDMIAILCTGLEANKTLTHVDLSHNKIGNKGIHSLCKVLSQPHCQWQHLLLVNNRISPKGARSLAKALAANRTLCTLNLRMNRLDDEGGKAICEALVEQKREDGSLPWNTTLVSLNIACNGLREETAKELSWVVRLHTALKELYLYGNPIGQDAGAQLREGIEASATIQVVDVRECGLAKQDTELIQEALKRNTAEAKRKEGKKPRTVAAV